MDNPKKENPEPNTIPTHSEVEEEKKTTRKETSFPNCFIPRNFSLSLLGESKGNPTISFQSWSSVIQALKRRSTGFSDPEEKEHQEQKKMLMGWDPKGNHRSPTIHHRPLTAALGGTLHVNWISLPSHPRESETDDPFLFLPPHPPVPFYLFIHYLPAPFFFYLSRENFFFFSQP